jgi:hypothetical protein
VDALFGRVWKLLERKYSHVVPGRKLMSFTSFLKTFAADLLKGISIASAVAQGVDPLIKASNPAAASKIETAVSELGTIGNLATIAETMAQAITTAPAGPQKLAAVLPYVSTLIQNSELLSGKQIADEAGFQNGVTQVINGVVAILNSCKKAGSQVTVPVAVAIPAAPLNPPPAAPLVADR